MLWMSRYIMARVTEIYNVEVTFDPKPIPGDWNGAGGHVNFSNVDTRTEGTGWDAIQAQIGKLEKRHAVHIAQYGEVGGVAALGGAVAVCSRSSTWFVGQQVFAAVMLCNTTSCLQAGQPAVACAALTLEGVLRYVCHVCVHRHL